MLSLFCNKLLFFPPKQTHAFLYIFISVHKLEDTQISCSVTGNKNQDQIYKFIPQDHVWSNISRCEFEKQREQILYRWHDQHGWLFLSMGWGWFDWVNVIVLISKLNFIFIFSLSIRGLYCISILVFVVICINNLLFKKIVQV